MELTEKYKIVVIFFGNTRPSNDYLKHIWNIAIRNEFESSGIYVNVIIDEKELACVECIDDEKCYVITAIRNPNRTPSMSDYYTALANIVFSVRSYINYPYTLIVSEKVDVAYFPAGT